MYTFVNRIVILLALFAFTACEPAEIIDPSFTQRAAPELPSAEMYAMPIELLTESDVDTTVRSKSPHFGPTYRNWAHSVVSLVLWNTGIAIHTAIPITSFGLAVNEEPVLIEEGSYEWSYQYEAPAILGGKTYDVVLTGTYISLEEVEWKMFLSEEGGFQNFEWFSGIVDADFSSARFVLYKDPLDPTPFMNINFEGLNSPSDVPNSDFKLRYTNIDPTDKGIGAYVEFRTQPKNDLNRAFDVKGGPGNPNLSTEMEWDIPMGNGRVRDKARFGDNEWHCWNEFLQDVGC